MTDIFKKLIKRLEDVKKLKKVSIPDIIGSSMKAEPKMTEVFKGLLEKL